MAFCSLTNSVGVLASDAVSAPSGMGTMALLVQICMARDQSRPWMQPPLTDTKSWACVEDVLDRAWKSVREGKHKQELNEGV